MKTPIALSMLLSPFSLPHDERWCCPSHSALYFAPLTGIVFLCVLSEALVYGVYLLAKKKRQAAM